MTLRITAEVLPHGDDQRRYVVGTLTLTNLGPRKDGSGLAHYKAVLESPSGVGLPPLMTTICDFPRLERGAFDLALWALYVLLGEQNPEISGKPLDCGKPLSVHWPEARHD